MRATASSDGVHLLSLEQQSGLWARFEAGQRAGGRAARGRAPRVQYQRDDIVVKVTQPGGGTTTKMVYTREISSGGMSFLHPGFLYTGTKVSIILRRRTGGEETVHGTVSWCRHIQGIWHATGVKYAEAIFPKIFAAPSAWENLSEAKKVEPDRLTGDLLLVDSSELDRSLLEFALKPTKLKVTVAGSLADAVLAAGQQAYDVVLIDVMSAGQGMSPEKVIDEIQAAGCKGTIVAIGVDVIKHADSLKTKGIQLMLPKPFSPAQLLSLVGTALNIEGTEDLSPVYSDLAGQDGIGPLLQQFCNKAKQSLRDLNRAIQASDLAAVRLFCQTMVGSGGGFGYQAVSSAAAEAITALDAGMDVAEAAAELQKLQALCLRLSPQHKPDGGGRAGGR
jgi:CheY-like chemotaxis protein